MTTSKSAEKAWMNVEALPSARVSDVFKRILSVTSRVKGLAKFVLDLRSVLFEVYVGGK